MKPRADGLFARLKPSQRDELLTLLCQGGDLEAGLKLCKGWGVPTSLSALSRFYSTHAFAWRLERAKAAAAAATGISPAQAEEAKSALLSQKIFEAVASADCPPKVLIALRGLEVKAEALRLSERRVSLLEKKISDAKKVLDAGDGSAAERERKLKAIFGI